MTFGSGSFNIFFINGIAFLLLNLPTADAISFFTFEVGSLYKKLSNFFKSLSLFNFASVAKDLHVFGIGLYDIKFDGGSTNQATDFRYERRFDNPLVDIGPEEENFFYLKPFVGIESTSVNFSMNFNDKVYSKEIK